MKSIANSQAFVSKDLRKKSYKYNRLLLYYTMFFLLLFLLVYWGYLSGDVSFIRRGDSSRQHLKALIYFWEFTREIIKSIFVEHSFVIPQWDFEIGLGSDVITTFSYYTMGDPFNYLCFLVSKDNIHLYYQFMMVFRTYCAGLSFIALCRETKQKSFYGIIVGALTYAYSSYIFYAAFRHPYFINPIIFLPLIVIGVERIIKGKSFLTFAFMVAVAEFSNFYFFYMLVLLTAIYVFVRFVCLYKTDIKQMLTPFFRLFFGAVLGVMMGAVLFLPTVIAFLSDARADISRTVDVFYSLNYYSKLPLTLLTTGTDGVWLIPGMCALFFPCVAVMLTRRKKALHLKLLLIASVIFMLLPVFGMIFNGFSYVSNRWVFSFSLLGAYIITDNWGLLLRGSKKHIVSINIISAFLAVCCIVLKRSRDEKAIAPILIIFSVSAVLMLKYFKVIKLKTATIQKAFVCLAIVSISVNAFYFFSEQKGNYIDEFYTNEQAENLSYKSNRYVLKEIQNDDADDMFYRYSGRNLSCNTSFIDNLKNTQFYWSLSNKNISAFRNEFNMREYSIYNYEGFDDRTAINTLSSVKYFYNDEKSNLSVPYGYVKTNTSYVWENKYTLPLGYTYESYITLDEFNEYANSIEKQEVMLQSVVLEKTECTAEEYKPNTTAYTLPYDIEYSGDDISRQKNSFVTTKKNTKITLYFENVEDAEFYLSFTDLEFDSTDPYELYGDDETVDPLGLYGLDDFEKLSEKKKASLLSKSKSWVDKTSVELPITAYTSENQSFKKLMELKTPTAIYYNGRTDFDVNLGYSEQGYCKIEITFPLIGVYSFDNIEIIVQPMKNYAKQISALKEDLMENVIIDTNIVKGTVSLDKSKILCLSIPYSDGWTAYVDGEESELLKANLMYCAIQLGKGTHEIELRYETPGLKLGMVISAFGWLLFFCAAYYYCIYNKNKSKTGGRL